MNKSKVKYYLEHIEYTPECSACFNVIKSDFFIIPIYDEEAFILRPTAICASCMENKQLINIKEYQEIANDLL